MNSSSQGRRRMVLHLGWHHGLAASDVVSIAPFLVPNGWKMADFLFKKVSNGPLNFFYLGRRHLWATTWLLLSTSLHRQVWACREVSCSPFASDGCWTLMALRICSRLSLYFWSDLQSFWQMLVFCLCLWDRQAPVPSMRAVCQITGAADQTLFSTHPRRLHDYQQTRPP